MFDVYTSSFKLPSSISSRCFKFWLKLNKIQSDEEKRDLRANQNNGKAECSNLCWCSNLRSWRKKWTQTCLLIYPTYYKKNHLQSKILGSMIMRVYNFIYLNHIHFDIKTSHSLVLQKERMKRLQGGKITCSPCLLLCTVLI